jgi:Heterokaryon incompatibility protein (HET)
MTESATTLYPELPLGEFIRVLDLFPGRGDETLFGGLRICEVGQSPYIALSYVCGNTTLTQSIRVSGHQLGIYQNAFELLTRFRHATEIVTVWIDGICINQNDAKEKEREVAFMYKIYETASCCNIWLGPSDEDSRIAIEYAKTLDGDTLLREYSPCLEFGMGSGYWERKSHVLDVLSEQPGKEALINACAKFLLRPWFTRVGTGSF